MYRIGLLVWLLLGVGCGEEGIESVVTARWSFASIGGEARGCPVGFGMVRIATEGDEHGAPTVVPCEAGEAEHVVTIGGAGMAMAIGIATSVEDEAGAVYARSPAHRRWIDGAALETESVFYVDAGHYTLAWPEQAQAQDGEAPRACSEGIEVALQPVMVGSPARSYEHPCFAPSRYDDPIEVSAPIPPGRYVAVAYAGGEAIAERELEITAPAGLAPLVEAAP